MRKLFYIFLLFLLYVPLSHAAIYTAYFADDGTDDIVGTWDASECTSGDPCDTLTEAQQVIDDLTSGDTVTLYFAKGDTWTVDSTANQVNHGLLIQSDDPIVHIDAYGSGDDPIFDGGVSDFSAADPHDAVNGPLLWSNILEFNRANCSVSNIEIKQMYGRSIVVTGDAFTLSGSMIHHFGADAISNGTGTCPSDTTVQTSMFHTGQQLYRYGLRGGWGAAIGIQSNTSNCTNTTVKNNVVYDIYGEGIIIHQGVVEENVIGDTYSSGIYYNGNGRSYAQDLIFRYNFVIFSSSATYRGISYGIGWWDEIDGGNQTGSDVEIYGNIVINRTYGIRIRQANGSDEAVDTFRVYNNTVIDCSTWNYELYTGNDVADAGYFYNNASIFFDRVDKHINDDAESKSNWTIDTNAYWDEIDGNGGTVDSDWQTNYVVTNPLLYGEEKGSPEDWDGQSGATYFVDIDFADIVPTTGSSLIDSGLSIPGAWTNIVLRAGTAWNSDPESGIWKIATVTTEDIGAVFYHSEAVDPSTSGWNPAKSATGVSRTANIVAHVTDAGAGVDIDTIQMDVEGTNYCCTQMQGTCPDSGTKVLTCTGGESDYTITKQNNSWSYDQEINVTIDADDIAATPNSMTQDSYSFTVESDVAPPDPDAQFSIGSGNKDITIGGGSQTITIQ